MAQAAARTTPARSTSQDAQVDAMGAAVAQQGGSLDREKVLPLPGWLVKVYFIFPVILYIPDAIFNYYVYSDGWNTTGAGPLVEVGKVALVSFLSIGVVGMAYLLSVLAPWHWGQGHRIQAFFCALGVIIATAITTWNSLAYRSESFVQFNTDKWAYNLWPTLQANRISITMILVSIAPPFWGLFWAIVQPTETGRSLRQLQESHAERLMRVQHEAEVKRLKAETNAKVREAQLRGMARTAAAARDQAAEVLRRKKAGEEGETGEQPAVAAQTDTAASQSDDPNASDGGRDAHKIVNLPTVNTREPGHSRSASFMNSVAPAGPSMHMEPAGGAGRLASQSPLFADSDPNGMPASDTSGATWTRRPPTFAGELLDGDATDSDAMTGTTGPRQAVRRSYESGSLMRSMNEAPAAYTRAYDEAMSELKAGGKKSVTATALNRRVAEKLNIDEAHAKTIVARVRESRRSSRS